MDERGFLNLSLASSWTNDALRWWFRNSPETKLVLEVNSHTPRVCGLEQFGNNEIHISQVPLVVEDSTPLMSYSLPEPNEVALAIAAHVAGLLEDVATILRGLRPIPLGDA